MATILIVEDDDINLRYMAAVVRTAGYGSTTVATGKEAIEAVQYGAIDAILVDIGLPDVDGIELCGLLRAHTDVPIIFVSGRDDEMSKVLALDAGGDDYVTKPFSAGELTARIRSNLRRHTLHAGSAPGGLASRFVSEEGETRYRIVLGDTCPICRAASRISFTSENPPRLPIEGCQSPDGCACTLPIFADELDAVLAEDSQGLPEGDRIADQDLEGALSGQPRSVCERTGAGQRETLAQLTQAYEQHEILGIVIQTESGACGACTNAARDLYLPKMAPPLPLAGCSRPQGCRCSYAAAGIDPRRMPPPISVLGIQDLQIPDRFHNAACFGLEQKVSCKPRDLAAYLEAFPLIPFPVDIALQQGEGAYLARRGHRGWERVREAGAGTQGPCFPFEGSLSHWVAAAGRPAPVPWDSVTIREEGLVYLTNWRLLFQRAHTLDSTLLIDITKVEYLRDGIACTVGARPKRLLFFVKDSLQVGLYLTQAIRDVRVHLAAGSGSSGD